ncbi:MAG: M48 family metallopeptidase [Planctomycetes bacterium]|nr:M48 family metallopeptidase [Planctomycetota bacterium]
MKSQVHSVSWGSNVIGFALQRSDRKRVAIEVNPDLSVVVKAPTTARIEPVLGAVRKKARWILRQRNYFEQFLPRTPERVFRSGETHLYLGRRYRLKVHESADAPLVKLSGGYIHLWCRNGASPEARKLILEAWYAAAIARLAQVTLSGCLRHRLLRAIPAPTIAVRKLKKRWASITKKGRLQLNPDVIRAPRRCLEYVLTHELCHVVVPNHSSQFFKLLTRVMPDWRSRKQDLERTLS